MYKEKYLFDLLGRCRLRKNSDIKINKSIFYRQVQVIMHEKVLFQVTSCHDSYRYKCFSNSHSYFFDITVDEALRLVKKETLEYSRNIKIKKILNNE